MSSKSNLDSIRLSSSVRDIQSPNLYRSFCAEVVGMFLLIIIGVSAGTKDVNSDTFDPNAVRIALCAGLNLATQIWIFEEVSGAHINPCVTVAFWITRRVSLVRAVVYLCAQFAGGVFAAYIAQSLTIKGANDDLGLTVPHPKLNGTPWKPVLIELIITYIMLAVTFSCIDKGRYDLGGSRPLSVGITVTVACLAFLPLTGCAMNPLRALSPAIILGRFQNQWIYWVGPIAGACLAGLSYDFVFSTTASPAKFRKFIMDPLYDPDADFYEDICEVQSPEESQNNSSKDFPVVCNGSRNISREEQQS